MTHNTSPSFYRIDQDGIIIVRGPDAKKFLQGQVTCDVDTLFVTDNTTTNDHILHPTSLGAHCTHKGRIVFTFRALTLDEQTIALKLPLDNIETAITALKKYIVFSKANITNISDDYEIIGVDTHSGNATSTFITTLASVKLTPPETTNTAIINHDNSDTPLVIVSVSDSLYELWVPKKDNNTSQKVLMNNPFEAQKHWNFLMINAGIPSIHQATKEIFTPHSINLHTIANGVSFTKGCYTGQEVVARMEYLGKLKKQLFLFEYSSKEHQIDKPITIASPLYTSDKTQSIGDIVLIAEHEDIVKLLASVSIEYAESNKVYLDQDCQYKIEKIITESL